ncbi:hypothetical protein AVEN_207026-1 [Araneus ventricosus]|uniref:Uncharacterized protein n=1 Tax=Araneus ventricosus TaxID=182803 RepID=A0A4Y2GMQ9_ARAVE|nr:hypothetical protein AVEN_207026-1 [Araneus ventricosus]
MHSSDVASSVYEGRGSLVLRSRLWGRRASGSKPDSTEDPPCMEHAKSYLGAKRPPVGVARKFEERAPDQASSSLSDSGSIFRNPSQNSPHVSSKRDVNKAKIFRLLLFILIHSDG